MMLKHVYSITFGGTFEVLYKMFLQKMINPTTSLSEVPLAFILPIILYITITTNYYLIKSFIYNLFFFCPQDQPPCAMDGARREINASKKC